MKLKLATPKLDVEVWNHMKHDIHLSFFMECQYYDQSDCSDTVVDICILVRGMRRQKFFY